MIVSLQNRIISLALRTVPLLLLLVLMSGCTICRTGCCTFRFQCNSCLCSSTCRPEVMVKYPPCIIDYAPDCGGPENSRKVTPIPPEYLQARQSRKGDYRIAIGDILEVSVLTHDENTAENVLVAPDGNIYYSFLPAIPAVGRTAQEVGADIEAGMAKVLVTPSVLVVPKVKSGQYYMILGKVYRPGVYPIQSAVNLRQAIGEAGGIMLGSFGYTTGAIANLGESFVVRQGERLDIDFDKLIYKGGDDQNIYLRPGDYVYIASALNQEIYMVGSIPARIAPYRTGLTLVGTLAGAYGAVSADPYAQGNWRDVLIIRGRLKCPCVIRADFKSIIEGYAKDIYLQPGDIVYVPNKTARFGRALIQLAINAFISSFVSNVANYAAEKTLGVIND